MSKDQPQHGENGATRRDFLKLAGLLTAALLPACRRVEEYIVPYRTGPEWNIPGADISYATCIPHARGAAPLLAVCQEGRPTRLHPNPEYPDHSGLDAITQATILDLYSPQRATAPTFHGRPADPAEFEGAFAAWSRNVRENGRIGFLFHQAQSPVREALIREIRQKNPNARFYAWEPLASHEGKALAEAIAPGTVQTCHLDQASRILTIGRDFLGLFPIGPNRAFSLGKTPEGEHYAHPQGQYAKLTKLYAAETDYTITGGIADDRYPLHPDETATLIHALAASLHQLTGHPDLAPYGSEPLPGTPLHRWAHACMKDLHRHSGECLILLAPEAPASLHHVVLTLNVILQATESTLTFHRKPENPIPYGDLLRDLLRDLREKTIETLFILAPQDTFDTLPELHAALRDTPIESIRLAYYGNDRLSAHCTWTIPATHYLEEWGMEYDPSGRLCLRQPMILPLHDSASELEILSGLIGSKGKLITAGNAPNNLSPAYHRTRKTFNLLLGIPAYEQETLWQQTLRQGYTSATAYPAIHTIPKPPAHAIPPGALKPGIALLRRPWSYRAYDGRYRRNLWLQEMPDPVSGMACGDAALLSPELAATLGGKTESLQTLTAAIGKTHICCPALPYPGIPQNTVILPRHIDLPGSRLQAFASSLRLSPLPQSTEAIHPPTILQGSVEHAPQLLDAPPGTTGQPPTLNLADRTPDTREQWGMSIDLNICTGCNACLIACRAENNIPLVGKQDLIKGRDLQWIRIDRYLRHRPGASSPTLQSVPVACQQCEAAPCESVCPVNATVHTDDGLNAMVYPRCWGTRYCSANCPYKARKFNFFDYAKASEADTKYQRNPNVTVRSRGVMEKCSYCVQRIVQAKARHRSGLMQGTGERPSTELELTEDMLRLPHGAVQTACQQACPQQAITFGNLLKLAKPSATYNAQSSPRASRLLDNLGTRPRTAYLSRYSPPPNRD